MARTYTENRERYLDGHDDVDGHVRLSRRVLAIAAALVVLRFVVQFLLGASPELILVWPVLLAWPAVADHEAVLAAVVTVGYAVAFGLAAVVAVGVRVRPRRWATGAVIVGRLVVVDVVVYLGCVAAWVLLARSSLPVAVAMLLLVVVPNLLLLGAGVTTVRYAREVTDDPDTPSRSGPRRPLDRTRDLRSWALAPVAALAGAPLLAAVVLGLLLLKSFTAANGADINDFCAANPTTPCMDVTARWFTQGALAFLVLWAALWCLPWWRGLRTARVWAATGVVLVAAAVPVGLLAPDRFPL